MARVISDELARHGIAAAIVSPGSRSGAMAVALEQSDIPVRVVLDERSAAFQGLGMARATGRPVVCVSTSGTAAANYLPAVVEADLSGVPLLLITADRPPELREVGANQTIDQVELFGSKLRWFCDVGVATTDIDANAYWRSTVSQAVARATGFGLSPGPVHLNVSFREPTMPVPHDGRTAGAPYPFPIVGRDDGGRWQENDVSSPTRADLGELSGLNGLLIVGEGTGSDHRLLDHAERLGWPVLATALSGLRGEGVITSYHHLLVDGVPDSLKPDFVVTSGRLGPSDRLGHLTKGAAASVHVDRWGRWQDPRRDATRLVAGDLTLGLESIDTGAPREFLEVWRAADAQMRQALSDRMQTDESLTGPRIAASLNTVPWSALVAASSMPIRDVDAFVRRPGPVFGNRGASGIDGFNSTVIGVAGAIRRTVGLAGDLSFLHDLPGLLAAEGDFVLVVIDNNGGGLFDLLPQAQHAPSFERLFVAPHGRDLMSLGRGLGLSSVRVGDIDELEESVSSGLEAGGPHIVVAPVDRGDDLKQRRGLDEVGRLVG